MSYFEDSIEPHIGRLPKFDEVYYNSSDYNIKLVKKTKKTYLLYFINKKYETWVPISMCETLVDFKSTEVSIYDKFNIKPINEVKEVEWHLK